MNKQIHSVTFWFLLFYIVSRLRPLWLCLTLVIVTLRDPRDRERSMVQMFFLFKCENEIRVVLWDWDTQVQSTLTSSYNLPLNPRRWPVTHLLSCNHDAVTYLDSHAGQLNFGFLWESRRRGSLQREGQRGAGSGQSPPQQSPQLFGHGSGVCHLQGHIQGVGNNVCRAVAFVILEKTAGTVGQLTAQIFA